MFYRTRVIVENDQAQLKIAYPLIKEARKLTQNEVDKIRDALDIIQNIRQLREEKRVLENKPRSTRRGVLMNQLQTLGKLGLEVFYLFRVFAKRKNK